jgi:hypothetical protein
MDNASKAIAAVVIMSFIEISRREEDLRASTDGDYLR